MTLLGSLDGSGIAEVGSLGGDGDEVGIGGIFRCVLSILH